MIISLGGLDLSRVVGIYGGTGQATNHEREAMYMRIFDGMWAVRDTISRSLSMHPSLLADSLKAVARIHNQAGSVAWDREASRIAHRMAVDCIECAAWVQLGDLDAIMAGSMCQWQTAYMQACKLLLISTSEQAAVMQAVDRDTVANKVGA